MIVNFLQIGPTLIGDKYQKEISYISNWEDLILHFQKNLSIYFNFFVNPIFLFFLIAYLTQKFMRFANRN